MDLVFRMAERDTQIFLVYRLREVVFPDIGILVVRYQGGVEVAFNGYLI